MQAKSAAGCEATELVCRVMIMAANSASKAAATSSAADSPTLSAAPQAALPSTESHQSPSFWWDAIEKATARVEEAFVDAIGDAVTVEKPIFIEKVTPLLKEFLCKHLEGSAKVEEGVKGSGGQLSRLLVTFVLNEHGGASDWLRTALLKGLDASGVLNMRARTCHGAPRTPREHSRLTIPARCSCICHAFRFPCMCAQSI